MRHLSHGPCSRSGRSRTRRAGFTMVELLAVVVIMALLGGIVMGIASYASRRAAEAEAQATLQRIRNALEEYRLQYGRYPSIDGAVVADAWDQTFGGEPLWRILAEFDPDLDREKGLEQNPPRDPFEDPWGAIYVYHSTGRFSYELFSWGANGIQDGVLPTERNRVLTIE